jgi:sirohydrochlorin cobaltochelatase
MSPHHAKIQVLQMTHEALVLAAHGSHLSPTSGETARRHAAAIRCLGRFHQVIAAFWKEFPSLRDVRYLLDAERAFVVPLFMADGYFSRRVVPRELDLDGDVTERNGVRLHYTPPVGTDAEMRRVIRTRVAAAVAGKLPDDQLGVVVVGHGTVQNPRSKEAVLSHVEALEHEAGYGAVAAAYLEEPPHIGDVPDLLSTPAIVVVPLFVADGYHTLADLPAALGLQPDAAGGWPAPQLVGGRRIYYTSAVGNDPTMVDVILERVRQARVRDGATA